MADVDYTDYDPTPRGAVPGRYSHFVNLVGAACSVALIAGIGLWGYKLAVRDVTGVPVMRALSGPLRIAPENPGGEIAAHQGLAVNAVAETGTASPLPDQLVLAPRALDLSVEDEAGLAVLPLSGEAAGADGWPAALDLDATAPVAPPPDGGTAGIATDAVALALAEALADGVPVDGDLTEGEGAPVLLAADGGLIRSPRPQARPVDGVVSAVQDVSAVAAVEVDPSTLEPGTRLAQLGAFEEIDAARAEWATLAGRHAALMAGKAMVIMAAQSGGRTFYRLRAHGFSDEDDARRFCTALVAENVKTCIPVAHR